MVLTDNTVVQIMGAPSAGRQGVDESTDLQEFKEVLEGVIAGTGVEVGATTADMIIYVDSATKNVEFTEVNSLFDNARVLGYIRGAGASIGSTSTPTALPIFDTGFITSSAVLTATAGDLGITTILPSTFSVNVTASLEAATNADFNFGVYAGGSLCGRVTNVSGSGTGKDVNFSMQCITPTLSPNDTIELRVSDDGDTIVNISADMKVEFAGL